MIPPGLDNTIEVFDHNGQTYVANNGQRILYADAPTAVREPFQCELIGDKKAMHCLKHKMQIVDANGMELKFVSCRYGRYNSVPDVVNTHTVPDAPDCPNESTCPGFGIVCLIPGNLTPQEYRIVKLVAKGLPDKLIAAELNCEVNTVHTHMSRIHQKLGFYNRVEIAMWLIKQ